MPDVAAFLRDVDILVQCSDDEGTPRAVLEGMAMGLAIVGTSVGGIPELLDAPNGRAGIVVPPADLEALAEAVRSLAVNPKLRGELGKVARSRAVTSFSADREWLGYENLYQRVISNHGRWITR